MSKIKSITKKKITTEKLYNLSVHEDETFLANDIVVHNCKSYIEPIIDVKEIKKGEQVENLNPDKKSIESIQFSESCCG